MSRWKASGIHLLVSLVVATSAIVLVLLLLFPDPYAQSSGAHRLLSILIGVDVTLGPLITLIIYKQGKRGLKFDLAAIAFLQIAALIYGLYAIAQARPIYLVYMNDRFSLVPARLITEEEMAKASPPFDRKPLRGPILVGTYVSQEDRPIMMDALLAGFDLDVQPMFFIDYRLQTQDIVAKATPLKELLDFSDEANKAVIDWANGRALDDYFYYPLVTNNGYQTLVLDKLTVEPAGIIPVDPW